MTNQVDSLKDYLPFADYAVPTQWNGLILVGEAPGAEEARQGRPFVGRSGQLLDKILQQASIEREECLIANVFRYQPPKNKIDHFFVSRRRAQTQSITIAEQYGKFGSAFCRSEFSSELDALHDLLAERRPRAVVALGRTPLWALTGTNGLLDKAGKFLPSRSAFKVQVMPTYHPSFILRGNWGLQDAWREHLVMARDLNA